MKFFVGDGKQIEADIGRALKNTMSPELNDYILEENYNFSDSQLLLAIQHQTFMVSRD